MSVVGVGAKSLVGIGRAMKRYKEFRSLSENSGEKMGVEKSYTQDRTRSAKKSCATVDVKSALSSVVSSAHSTTVAN